MNGGDSGAALFVGSHGREEPAMKRWGSCAASLVFAVSLWAPPAGAQDKFTMGMTGGT